MSILNDTLLNIRAVIKQILPAQPCVLCGSMSHDGLWCMACDRALPYLDIAHCPTCALPIPSGEVCGQCLQHPPLFVRTTAVFGYAFPLDKLIQAMKYGEQLALAHAFAEKLAQHIDRNNLPDCIIPMPLHPAKLRERGFNQSQLIAAKIARDLDLKLLPDACRRIRDTPPQSALPWKERKKNVRNAFRCDADLTGKHVALVDDVLTTGASLNAIADAVQRRGASEISAWVVARTLPRSGYRRQKTEDRRQKTEDRRQKTEDRRQKTEDRRQKTEVLLRLRRIFIKKCRIAAHKNLSPVFCHLSSENQSPLSFCCTNAPSSGLSVFDSSARL